MYSQRLPPLHRKVHIPERYRSRNSRLEAKRRKDFEKFLDLDKVCNISPGAKSIGPDGSEVKILTYWKNSDKTNTEFGGVQEFFAGLESVDTADGMDHTFTDTFGLSPGYPNLLASFKTRVLEHQSHD